jgi:hypothetical protein
MERGIRSSFNYPSCTLFLAHGMSKGMGHWFHCRKDGEVVPHVKFEWSMVCILSEVEHEV